MTSAAVHLEQVGRSFGEEPVLEDVSLRIAPGEAVALLGRSGSGKSTLLNLVAGLLAPDHGRIEVAGHRLDGASESVRAALRRRRIGYVFQQFNLIPTLTVLENLEFPIALAGGRVPRGELRARLEALGLRAMADRFPEALSGGEQQRLAVLRALAHAPAVVLADEPTANLDLDNARRVMELLHDEARRRAAALLLVTHSSDLCVDMDRVLRIQDRSLVAER